MSFIRLTDMVFLLYIQGCLEKIWSYVTQYSDAFILAAVVICSLEVQTTFCKFFNDLVLCLLFDFFKSQTITSISCIFRLYLVSLTKDNEICYNVINNFIRKIFYRDYVI